INFGIWVDHQANTRGQWEIDENTNGFNTANGNPVDRNQQDTLVNMQPYAEFVWNVTNKLTVTPGLKEAYFSRNLNAVVNQGTGLPLQYSRSWNKLLPSIDAHYKLASNWSAYVQYAQGFIAPNLNTLYVTNPSLSSFDPESTKNYQAGTTWSSPRLTLSADVYDILFSNKIGSKTIAGNTIFLNLGGATYKGFESEATYYVGMGLSAYGNFSLNSAKDKTTGQWMANAPKDTAAAGLIYNKGPVYLSAITKFVGSRYGDNGESQHLGGYATTDMAFNYTLKNADGYLKNAKIGLRLNNLFDRKNIFALAGYTGGANTPLYWTVPGRSFEVTVSTSM
ncbi:MAG TPA: TonB-dependent receptor, partial [Burkholderiales bacterium]|nr:TonB-dependent receptor [Burkholderiales bacterium]